MATVGRMLFTNRAHDFMLHQQPEQRASMRVHVCLSATAAFPGKKRTELPALVRDVSSEGVMFYSNFPHSVAPPAEGSDVTLRFFMPIDDRHVRVRWVGKVVRLVRYPAGAATGIALRLHTQEMAELH
jgi:hypothetical protein